jgi:hypothetical protein
MFYYIWTYIFKQTTNAETWDNAYYLRARAHRRLRLEGYFGGGRALFYGDVYDLFA